MGRGGAYVASGEGNLNSLWYNPANLAALEKTTLTGDLSVIGLFSTYKRAPRTARNGETIRYPAVGNQALPTPDPQMLIGGPTGIEDLVWSAGLYAPYALRQRYPATGPQRYVLVDNSKSLMAYLHAAVAWEPTDWLRIGGGFQNMIAQYELVTMISGYSGLYGRPEDRDLDILSRVSPTDYFVPTGNAGVWIRPVEGLQIGSSVQLPATVRDEDTEFDVRMASHPSFDDARLTNDTVAGGLQFPLIARLGVRYRHDDFDVELAGVFEQWSVFDSIEVRPNDIDVEGVPGLGAIPVGPLSIEQNWEDTFSIRLGSAQHWNDSWTTRLGYTFETGAVPDDYYGLFAPDPNKHMFAAGATYRWGRWSLDASAAFHLMRNKTITNSKLRQINPIDTEDELATVVGNGQYRTDVLIVGTGINYAFD
jgi:long-chain fatty acid transport protein